MVAEWILGGLGLASVIGGLANSGDKGGGYWTSITPPKEPGKVYDENSWGQNQSVPYAPNSVAKKKMDDLEETGRTGLVNQQVDAARAQQEEMRKRYMEGLGQLQRRASGEDSVVAQQAQVARDKANRAWASQVATMAGQGGYSPAAARSAMMASAGSQQTLAGQTAAAMAQERQAAQDAYVRAIAGGRQQDQGLMQAELERERQRQAFFGQMAGLAQGYGQMDLQNKLAQQSGRQGHEQFLADLWMRGAIGGQQIGAQVDASNRAANAQLNSQLIGGGTQMAAGALGLAGLNERRDSDGWVTGPWTDPWK